MKKKTGGRDFTSETARLAGSKSSRALPEDLKSAREYNAKEFERLIYKHFSCSIEQLKELHKDPMTSARELVVIRILMAAIEKADFQRLNFLLERTIGKVKEKIEITGRVQTYKEISVKFDQMSDEEIKQNYLEHLKAVN